MSTFSKTLVAQATNTLGDDNKAAALTSAGRAYAAGENATKRLVKVFADDNTHPAFFVSPYDKQGKLNKKSLSRATGEQFDATKMLFASGMGKCAAKLAVNTNVELLAYSVDAANKRVADIKTAMANTKDAAKKKKLSVEIETIKATLTARNVLTRKIGPKFRDLSAALITEYKRRAKAKDGSEAANDLAAKLKEECGFASVKKDKPEPKEKVDVITQQAKNLLNALQEAEELPANGAKLITELNKLLNA